MSLASWAIAGSRRPNAKVFSFLEGKVQVRVERAEPEPPRRIDPAAALASARSVRDVNDPRLIAWLAARRLPQTIPAGWLPNFRATWWTGSRTWPLVIPACTGTGKVESLHGIAVEAAPHKTTWPLGAESRELLFAAPKTRAWLQGKAKAPRDVIVVEGASDFLTANVVFEGDAVLGITSGGASALSLVPRVRGQRWYVATDPDEAGRMYARKVAEAVYPHPVYPFPMERT